jgi:hypothetical protein
MNPFILATAQLAPVILMGLAGALIRAQFHSHGARMIAALRGEQP